MTVIYSVHDQITIIIVSCFVFMDLIQYVPIYDLLEEKEQSLVIALETV